MLRGIVAIIVAAGAAGLWYWLVIRPIDAGSVSDAWRAEQRGRKDHD